MIKRAEIIVRGRVQGVFFRDEAKRVATKLNICGFVKNENDGSVRIIAEGEEEKLQEFIKWCRKGTKWSFVQDLEIVWREAEGNFTQFEIRL